MASKKPTTKEGQLERLMTEFVSELGGCQSYAIASSFRELKSYVDQLKTLNIHYSWQRYELCEKLYDEWKKRQEK